MCFYGKLKPVDLDIPKDKLFACTVISSSDILNIFSTLIQCYNIHFQVHVCYKALFFHLRSTCSYGSGRGYRIELYLPEN